MKNKQIVQLSPSSGGGGLQLYEHHIKIKIFLGSNEGFIAMSITNRDSNAIDTSAKFKKLLYDLNPNLDELFIANGGVADTSGSTQYYHDILGVQLLNYVPNVEDSGMLQYYARRITHTSTKLTAPAIMQTFTISNAAPLTDIVHPL